MGQKMFKIQLYLWGLRALNESFKHQTLRCYSYFIVSFNIFVFINILLKLKQNI